MDFLSRMFSGFGKKGILDDAPSSWLPISGGISGVSQAQLLEANREWVFIAVDTVASSVAGIRFKVMRYQRSGDDREVFDGPLVDFLEKPGPGFTGKDFIYLNTAWKELTGNAVWEKLPGRKVRPLIPTRVMPVYDTNQTEIIGFRVSDKTGQRVLAPEDVLHDRYIDPASPLWGHGKLAKIAKWADVSSFTSEFLRRFFVNGTMLAGFLETEEATEGRIKLIKAALANDYSGTSNAHKILPLPKGQKFTKADIDFAKVEMGATDDRYRDKILSAFKVPKTLVGLTTEVNRASAEASEYVFAKYTVKPIVDDLIEFLNVNVAPTLDRSGTFYFAYDDFIPDNQEIKLREREIALNRQPYMTVNEVRASVGLPPVEGGDFVYGSPMQLPLGTPLPDPAALPGNDEEEPEDEEPQRALPARARQAFKGERTVASIAKRAAELMSSKDDPDAVAHKEFVGRISSFEREIEKEIQTYNLAQEEKVLQKLGTITKSVNREDVLDLTREISVMVDFITPILTAAMVAQAQADYLQLEFPGQLDLRAPAFARVVNLTAKRLAKSYNTTTAKLLANALSQGISDGDGLDGLTKRVKEVYAFSNTHRAKQVAQTEAFTIANKGSREAYRQSGVVKSIRWYTAEDERVCEFCGPMDGKIVGMSENFFDKGTTLTGANGGQLSLDYRTISEPALHPNCRCFLRPERIDID